MNDTLVTILLTILGSTAASSVIIAFFNRRKTKGETEKLSADTSVTTAQAFDLYLESNVKLQKQRDEDRARYEIQTREIELSYEKKLNELELKFTKEISELRERIRVLEQERSDLLIQNYSLLKKIESLEENANE